MSARTLGLVFGGINKLGPLAWKIWLEFRESTTQIPFSQVEARENSEVIGELGTELQNFDIKSELGRLHNLGKACFSSTTGIFGHQYEYSVLLDLGDPHKALNDPMLMVLYITKIPGFCGVLLPTHKDNKRFRDNSLSDQDYEQLRNSLTSNLNDKIALAQLALEGKMPPIDTIIFLGNDCVKVVEAVMDGTRLYVRLETTRKHTFRDGWSRHEFRLVPGSDKVEFVNHGEGRSKVPLRDSMNNSFAALMWGASGVLGARHYLRFKTLHPINEDLANFVCDTDGSFARDLGSWNDVKLMAVVKLVTCLGSTFGPLNLWLVTHFHKLQDNATDAAKAALERAKTWSQLSTRPKNIGSGLTAENLKLYEASWPNHNSVEAIADLLNDETDVNDVQTYNVGVALAAFFFDLPKLNIMENYSTTFHQELVSCINTKTMSEYRAGRFVALRELSITQAKKEIVLFNGKDRSPEDMKNDLLLNSSQEIQTRILFSLQEVLAAIMPQVREEMCQFSQGKIYPDVAPALFADTISLHICKVFFDQWYTAFLGAGGIIELWIDVAVVGCFKGPTVLDKTELYLNEWRNDLESFEKFYDDKVEEILNTPVGIVRQYLLLQLEPVREQLVTHKRKLVAAELRRSMAKQAAKDKAWPESVLEEKETKLFNAVVASQTQ